MIQQAEEEVLDEDSDLIQLDVAAVLERVPPYATADDVDAALFRCGLTQRQIFDELDRRCMGDAPVVAMGLEIITIIFEAFDEALADITAHKVPLYG